MSRAVLGVGLPSWYRRTGGEAANLPSLFFPGARAGLWSRVELSMLSALNSPFSTARNSCPVAPDADPTSLAVTSDARLVAP
eukprot:scaffold134972_cov22-Tisochrysis_lutea.AAC.1